MEDMEEESKQSYKRRQAIRSILKQASENPDLSKEINDRIERWQVDNETDADHRQVVAELFDEQPEVNRKPSREAVNTLQSVKRKLGFSTDTRVKTQPVPLYKRAYFRVASSAAAVLLIAAGLYFTLLNQSPDTGDGIAQHTGMDNAVGTVISLSAADSIPKEITLPDGSTVKVKHNSTLTYAGDFTENRQVNLKGEAYFSVVRDEEHPFVVESDNLRITVLGTEFNVKTSEKEAEIVLASGKVELQTGEETVVMEPEQKAVVDLSALHISVLGAGQGELLRVSGAGLTFRDKSLREALTITADYFGKVLLLEKGLVSDETFFIDSSASTPLEDILQSISFIAGTMEYRIEGDTISVTSKDE